MKKILRTTAILLSIMVSNFVSNAQGSGSLDETFANEGTVVTAIGTGYDTAAGLVIQPDQKIVIGGSALIGSQYTATLVRLNTDGTPDASFGSNGTAAGSIVSGSGLGSRNPLAIQPDGKLLFGSNTGIFGTYDFCVTRFNTDGTLDADFGTDGNAVKSAYPSDDYVHAIALQNDGKILTGGQGKFSTGFYHMAVTRMNTNGSIDSGFSDNGLFKLDLGDHDSRVDFIMLQPDGKIILAGNASFPNTNRDLVLIRLNADGSYDNSFGTSGMCTFSITSTNDYPLFAALQADGKMVICGSSPDGSYYDVFLLRFDASGQPDNSFGTNGLVISHISDKSDWAQSMVLDENGKIVVVGWHTVLLEEHGMVLRYNTDGSPDPAFGINGVAIIPATSYHVQNVSIQTDHKIVVAGSYVSGIDNSFEFAASRLLMEENVGFEDPANDALAIALFPNPATESVTIQTDRLGTGPVKITIADMAGRVVFRKEYFNQSNQFYEAIGVNGIAAGLYSLVIESNKGRAAIKLEVVETGK